MAGKHSAPKPEKPRCGAKYVRIINGHLFYSFCNKRKGHWGKHG